MFWCIWLSASVADFLNTVHYNNVFLFPSSHPKNNAEAWLPHQLLLVSSNSQLSKAVASLYLFVWNWACQRVSFILHDLKLKCYCVLNELLTRNGIITAGTPVRNVLARTYCYKWALILSYVCPCLWLMLSILLSQISGPLLSTIDLSYFPHILLVPLTVCTRTVHTLSLHLCFSCQTHTHLDFFLSHTTMLLTLYRRILIGRERRKGGGEKKRRIRGVEYRGGTRDKSVRSVPYLDPLS